MGASDAICLDFDFAIRTLKRWADRRSDETEQVPDHTPEKRQRTKTVPKYRTLMAVLGLDADGEQSPVQAGEVNELVAQMITGPSTWQPTDWPD